MNTSPILCVDDEPTNLALLRQALQGEYRLVFARGGNECLAAVEKHRPALILLDVQMPDMSGFDVARFLKRQSSSDAIPIIFVSTMSSEADEQAGFDAGGVDYIAKPISIPIVRARVRTHLSLVRASALEASHRAAISMLGEAGHYNDTDTGVHIWRMAAYCRLLAETLGWDRERAALLELAAPMHDTGKIGIPDAILKKPGKLDEAEWKIMQSHARIGFEILNKSDAPLFRVASEIALRHHERWDGKGYPDGLAGEGIPESARIVAVADVFDALTMRRPYKEAWSIERSLAYIQGEAGQHFDERIVQALLRRVPDMVSIKTRWDKEDSPA